MPGFPWIILNRRLQRSWNGQQEVWTIIPLEQFWDLLGHCVSQHCNPQLGVALTEECDRIHQTSSEVWLKTFPITARGSHTWHWNVHLDHFQTVWKTDLQRPSFKESWFPLALCSDACHWCYGLHTFKAKVKERVKSAWNTQIWFFLVVFCLKFCSFHFFSSLFERKVELYRESSKWYWKW